MNSTDSQLEKYSSNDLVIAQIKARRLSTVSNTVFGVIVLVALLFAGYQTRVSSHRADRADTRSEQNQGLLIKVTDQLETVSNELKDTRTQLAALQSNNADIDACSAKLSALVRSGTRDTLGALADLVILISTVVPSERESKVGPVIERLNKVRIAYKFSTETSNAWNLNQQLPCPV